jgi:hypothetical protein
VVRQIISSQLNTLNQRERMRGVTERSLAEVFKSVHAARAVEGMLEFEKNADACGVEAEFPARLSAGNFRVM